MGTWPKDLKIPRLSSFKLKLLHIAGRLNSHFIANNSDKGDWKAKETGSQEKKDTLKIWRGNQEMDHRRHQSSEGTNI